MTIYYNAKIFTNDGIKTWIETNDDTITATGVGEINGDIDMNGRVILPGLIDAHQHIYGIGRLASDLKLRGTGSIIDLQNRLEEYSVGKTDWIVGRGWDQGRFEDKRYPNRHDLDKIVKDVPVILYRACHHIAVINTKALEMASIDKSTPNPDGGEIEKDENGELTGILKENALDLVAQHIKIDYQTRKEMIYEGLKQCLSVGLTAVQTNDSKAWTIYSELQKEGKLPIRVYLTSFHKEMMENSIPSPGTQDNLLNCNRVKLFADGSLGAQTAAMREPYTDTGKFGIPIYSQEEMNGLVKKAKDRGYRVEIHAIGDRAAEIVINAVETVGDLDRPILTHAQILGDDLIDKMKNLGIIANIQPPFIITDGLWIDKRLGISERRKYSYAWRTLLERGVHCSGGSDAPIESHNPLIGIHAAIYRQVNDGSVWREEECLTFEQAIGLYTKGGAYTAKEEKRLGQLIPGFQADFIVIDKDIISDPQLLLSTKVLEVYVAGKKML